MRSRVVAIGLGALGALSLAVGVGYAIGRWDFVRQHFGALALAAALVVVMGTIAARLVGGVIRGAVISVRKPKELGQSGAAAAEFVITIIPFMIMLTALMQLSLASLARVLVSYSAFCAARAAVVMVPMEPKEVDTFKGAVASAINDEQENKVGYGANTRTDFAISKKAALIRNAAAYALIPASPSIDVVIQDTMLNWSDYIANRMKYGLDPLNYLEGMLGDLAGVPAAIVDSLADQIKEVIKGSMDSPEAKEKAKSTVDQWIDQNIKDPSAAEKAKQAADGYIDGYTGSEESPTGQLGNWAKDQITGALSGPLEQFKDKVNDAVDGAIGNVGGSAPSSMKGGSVDRALDSGFGSGTDGAGGAILRAMRKLIYARMGTVVTLVDQNGNFKTNFNWNEPITAKVTYLFYCQIPLANRFAGKAFYNLPDSTVADLATGPMKGLTIIGIPGYFIALTAEHTLTNQGKPL